MKKLIPFFAVVLFIVGCNNSADDVKTGEVSGDTLSFGHNSNDTLVVWNVDNENNTRKKVSVEEVESPNVQALINGMNMVYPDILIQFDKVENDTLFVSIPQSETLTQRMGSAGAAQFFSMVCVNLFEASGFNNIHFDFKEGDHARPGTFNRQQFANIKESN